MSENKITVSCPRGHHIRGDEKFIGRSVRCPRCEMEFVFTPASSLEAHDRQQAPSSQVTDTGVMRILGDISPAPNEQNKPSEQTRPCSRCGNPIAEHVTVCANCNLYVGVLPSYLQKLGGDQTTTAN